MRHNWLMFGKQPIQERFLFSLELIGALKVLLEER